MRTARVLLVPALAIVLAGCASPPDPGPSNLVHAALLGTANVFEPREIAVAAGETVTWDVVGDARHTVTFRVDPAGRAGAPDSGDFGPGDTWSLAFPVAGTYEYWCRYHASGSAGMVGTVVVT